MISPLHYFDSINLRLIETDKAIAERNRVADRLLRLDDEIERQVRIVETRRIVRDVEEADVIQLESLTFQTILLALFGAHQRRLAQEIEEWLDAKLKATQALIHLDALQQRHAELDEQLLALADCDADHDWLLAERDRLIRESDRASGQRLRKASTKLSALLGYRKELTEAHDAGERALEAASEIINTLKAGRNEGGLWTNTMRWTETESSLRTAVALAESAEQKIDRFQQELRDLPDHYKPVLDPETPAQPVAGDGESYLVGRTHVLTYPASEQERFRGWLTHLEQLVRYTRDNVQQLYDEVSLTQRRIDGLREEIGRLEQELFSAENFPH